MLHRFAHRHGQGVGDGLVLIGDAQGLLVESLAVTDLAGHVDIGQKCISTFRTPSPSQASQRPAFDIEAKARGGVPEELRLARTGVDGAYRIVELGVSGRVGARGAADRLLVDGDDLVQVLQTEDAVMVTDHLSAVMEMILQGRIEDVVQEARLAGAAYAGDAGQRTQGQGDGQVAQIVGAGAAHFQAGAATCRRRAGTGMRLRPLR